MKTKYNLGKLWFPKLINLWNFISYFILIDFKLSITDNFFIFQLLAIGDDVYVESSLFYIEITWKDELFIEFNFLFLIHLKYEYYNKSVNHEIILNILENCTYHKNYIKNEAFLPWLSINLHKSVGINKFIEIKCEDIKQYNIEFILTSNGIKKFKIKQLGENHFKIYNY